MKTNILLLYFLLPICLTACSKDDSAEASPAVRTVIVYMAADNDLWADALADVEELQAGFSEQRVNLVVFLDPVGEPPSLLKIAPGATETVKTYPELNSADASQLRQALSDAIALYPAERYGLALWSHGTSWLPAGRLLKSFGEDGGRQMNIPELAAALPVHFDFILFDACLMGSVEVAYELREKTDFIVASSTETIADGFPYDRIAPELLATEPDLRRVAERYFDFYAQQSGAYQSATVALVDARELEALAAATRELLSVRQVDLTDFDRSQVQRLDVYEEQYTFDFGDFMDKLLPEVDKSALAAQLNKTVLYKAHTAKFLDEYEIATFCGLSSYIPHSGRGDLNDYYRQLGWYTAGGYNKLF
ncbi:MAG: hypothetical protein LBF67_04055 [Prevotellaceae bacterium]|jgi:hypothetical protein|nr:hypothetical protein [Prevotellaceae bacterium]